MNEISKGELLVFIGHSRDARAEAKLIHGLEAQFQKMMKGRLKHLEHPPFTSVRAWEWAIDASGMSGRQKDVISPLLVAAHFAVFVFKERVGVEIWRTLNECRTLRQDRAPIAVVFPAHVPHPDRMNDLNVSIEWSTLQQRKRELSSGWGEDESSAIRPLDDYRDHNHLCEIVLNQFERDLENIIDRAMASRAQTRPALRNNISGEQQILLEDFRSGDFTRQRKALERLSVLAENHSPKFLAESVTLASEANRLDDQIRMGLIRGNDQALGISNLVQRGVELLNRIAQRPDSVPVRGAATKIVISYRRADSSGTTGRILDRLTGHYGKDSVFIDIDSIPVGADFRQHIREALEDCDIMLAIVGRKWLGPINRRNRINEPNDIVRLEIEMALQNGIAIVPVLVDGATMPKAGQLPDSFQNFTFRNAAIVGTGLDFHNHVDRLIASMDSSLKAKRRGGKTR